VASRRNARKRVSSTMRCGSKRIEGNGSRARRCARRRTSGTGQSYLHNGRSAYHGSSDCRLSVSRRSERSRASSALRGAGRLCAVGTNRLRRVSLEDELAGVRGRLQHAIGLHASLDFATSSSVVRTQVAGLAGARPGERTHKLGNVTLRGRVPACRIAADTMLSAAWRYGSGVA